MAEFVIAKQDPGLPTGWRPVAVVQANVPTTVDEARAIAKQGFVGPGRYAMARWDNRREYDMNPPATPDIVDIA